MSDGRVVVLYDAECGFCRWSLAQLLRWDTRRRLRPVALQDPEASRLLAGMTDGERMASLHVVDAGGRVSSAGAGLTALVAVLPGGRGPARVGSALPAVSESGYRIVARNRGRLGRLVGRRARRRADEVIRARG